MPRALSVLIRPARRAPRLVALLACLAAFVALTVGGSGAQPAAKGARGVVTPAPLPPHRVASTTSLAPRIGKRVEIHVRDARLTKAQCAALIEAYRSRGAPDGQVSVRKPARSLDGQLFPFCVENFDGRGVQFNDYAF